MEMVLQAKQIDQRDVVRETDFSKAKVSRIIKDLEERGLVSKISKGRKNIIKLSMKKPLKIKKESKEESKSNKIPKI